MSSIPEIPIDIKDIYGKGTNIKYLPFFLRFMLLCDQCHDFCEKDERNNWKNNIKEVFDRLNDSYKKDIEWLSQEMISKQITFEPHEISVIKNFEIDFETAKDTEKMVEKIDLLLSNSEISGQIPFNSTNFHDIDEKINPCSSSASLVLSVIKVLSEQSVSLSQFNVAVDADKSKMNLGSLLLFFCDRVASDKNTKINLINTIATKYDAASGSGTFSYLNKIQENLYKITKRNGGQIENFDETNENITINLKFYDISLIKFSYVNEEKEEKDEKAEKILTIFSEIFKNPKDINFVIGEINKIDDKIISIKELDNLKAILKEIIQIPTAIPIFPGASITTSWSGISKGLALFNTKLQSLGYAGPPLSKNKALFLLLFSILSLDPSLPGAFGSKLSSLTNTKKVVSLQISNFFAKTYTAGMDKMSEDQASVNSITKISFNDSTFPLEKLVNFKTLGDFGQILVYYIFITMKYNLLQFINFFITFDQICSRIASLFLKYTVFENLNKDVFISPMTVFVKKELLGNLTSATGALLSLMNTASGPTGSTGGTSSFGKSRYYNEKLIKLAKKYRIKLDKYTSQNIKNLLKLQNHAKKLGINITKKNSKGKRIYKTINELIKNIKQYSKKTKSSKKTNTSKNLTKEEKQKLLRSKSKKHGIKITKLNNKGIRVYKSNTQLINELKKKLKR